jgi:endo-1,4-beta-D-glucanase Y
MSFELKEAFELKDIFYVVGIAATFLISLVNIVYNIYINRRTTYINSVTSERVKWINALRENVSKYAGLTYNWVISDIEEGSEESKKILKEIDQLRILIQLQINPNEDLGKSIISCIDTISTHTHESQKEVLKKDLKGLVSDVQNLLKEEWDKVKDEAEKGRLPKKQKS